MLTTTVFAKKLSADKKAAECGNIKCIRNHIDYINDQILMLLAERTAYVRRAGIIKGPKQSASDPRRLQDELITIKKKSIQKNIPVEISLNTFNAMIQASIHYQQQYKTKFFNEH